MKVNGIRSIGMATSGEGAVKRQPKDCRRSAEPDDDVEALLPC